MKYKYNIGIGNGYGDCYISINNSGDFRLGVDCQVSNDSEITISESVAKELINNSSDEMLHEFVFEDYNFSSKWEEYELDKLLMYNEEWIPDTTDFIVTESYQAKDKFDFVMKLVEG